MTVRKIGLIGLGLIGGSLAKTIHRKFPQIQLIAYDTRQSELLRAMNDGVIQTGADVIDRRFCSCDIIFLAAPLAANMEVLGILKALDGMNPDVIITDTGSMKEEICRKARDLSMNECFIGGHPMAGTERSGYENANAYLFENVYEVITPDDAVPKEKTESLTEFLTSLDMVVLKMSACEHDYATANVSHLPHIVSAALVNLVKNNDSEEETLKAIAAGGFKDITRISSSSPDMWLQISRGNREQILPLLNQYIETLQEVEEALRADDAPRVRGFFSDAKDYRDSINTAKGTALRQNFMLYCDLIDEPGEIATIATRLATHRINVKNIGIRHNREFEEGVLYIEFYDAKALEEATALLKKFRYHIYERN